MNKESMERLCPELAKELDHGEDKVCPKPDPISRLLLDHARSVSEKAEKISGYAYEKLAPVMSPGPTTGEACGGGTPEVWPPLFDDLRDLLFKISNALVGIETALDRTEL